MSQSWSLTLLNKKDDAARFEPWFKSVVSEAALPQKAAFDLRLFFDEVLGNVYEYGFANGVGHSIDIKISYDGLSIFAEVSDDGTPFDPTSIQPRVKPKSAEEVTIGGWGVELIRNIAEEFTYDHLDGRNRLCIRLNHEAAS